MKQRSQWLPMYDWISLNCGSSASAPSSSTVRALLAAVRGRSPNWSIEAGRSNLPLLKERGWAPPALINNIEPLPSPTMAKAEMCRFSWLMRILFDRLDTSELLVLSNSGSACRRSVKVVFFLRPVCARGLRSGRAEQERDGEDPSTQEGV